jgi:hypothetical protein
LHYVQRTRTNSSDRSDEESWVRLPDGRVRVGGHGPAVVLIRGDSRFAAMLRKMNLPE